MTGNYNVAANGTARVQQILHMIATVTVDGHIHESGNVATGRSLDNQGGRNLSVLMR